MSTLRRSWPFWVLALLPILPLARIFLHQETLGPFEQIQRFGPWHEVESFKPWDVLQADGVLQFAIWRDLVFSSWAQGVLPAWNPYSLAGTPLLANSQSGALYPPHILVGVLRLDLWLALGLLAWFHLAVAGIGTARLSRAFGARPLGGFVAGASFALSPFLLGWLPLASVPSTVAWIPLAMAVAVELVKGERLAPRLALLAIAVAMMLMAGHLQFAAYGFLATGLVALGTLFTAKTDSAGAKARGLGWAVGALALGAMLAAPQLLPVLDYGKYSHRRGAPTEEGYQAFAGSAIPARDVAARLAMPMSQGNPTVEVEADAGLSTYWPAVSRPGANYAETAASVGPVVVFLLGVAFASRRAMRQAGPLLLVGLVALLLAVGTPLNRLLYFGVPGWSSTGSPGRVIVLFVLALCAIAGLAFSEDHSDDATPKRRLGWGLGALLIATVVGILAAQSIDAVPAGFPADAWAALTGAALGSVPIYLLAAAIAALAGAAWFLTDDLKLRTVAAFAPIAVAAVLGVFGLIRAAEENRLAVGYQMQDRIAVINDQWGMVLPSKAVFPPNTLAASRLHELGGYDSLLHRDTKALLDQINGQDSAPPANGNMMFIKPTASLAGLMDAGVTEVWSENQLPKFGKPKVGPGGVLMYEIGGPGRVVGPNAPGKIVAQNLRSVTVEAEGPGKLVLKDRLMPGWTASIGGNAVPITGTTWREVDLPAGPQRVEFRYTPPGLSTGLILAAVSGGILLLSLFLFQARDDKRKVAKAQVATIAVDSDSA